MKYARQKYLNIEHKVHISLLSTSQIQLTNSWAYIPSLSIAQCKRACKKISYIVTKESKVGSYYTRSKYSIIFNYSAGIVSPFVPVPHTSDSPISHYNYLNTCLFAESIDTSICTSSEVKNLVYKMREFYLKRYKGMNNK